MPERPARRGPAAILRVIGPGLLVAATGVGAGDLATAAFTGSRLGPAILWAVALGAFLKFCLNEGLARWQIATGETLLEGAVRRLGRGVSFVFLAYLLLWSFFVGSALMSACGVATHAMVPVFDDPARGKVVFGVAASALGWVLATVGGYRLFEKLMSACIAVMFVIVVVTAAVVCDDWGAVAKGLVIPRIPDAEAGGLTWTMALIGGVGGTLTVLCYGYWIREEGRTGEAALRTCRLDLALAYAATAVFGFSMVVIGASIEVSGSGAGLVVALADRLEEPLGRLGRWAFLLGAFGAVFSSLLGVWQAVPYLFADFWRLRRREAAAPAPVDTNSRAYRVYLAALATVPMLGLFVTFKEIQKAYAVFGSLFMPMLALALLALNGRASLVGERHRNRRPTTVVLVLTLVLFVVFGWQKAFGG